MLIQFKNNATGTLASGITSATTTIVLTGGHGAYFPSLTGSQYFYATLKDSLNNLEIVKVTARSGDSLTVTRAQEGTSSQATNDAGDTFEIRPTAAGLEAIYDEASGPAAINAGTSKATPVDADELPLYDSAATTTKKKLTWANLKATILGTAMTWTGVQTFTNSVIRLLGSSTGYTTITSANAGASNYTATLPAVTDTIVMRTTTDTLTNKRVTLRVGSTTSSATPTINTDNYDVYQLTAQAADITSFTTNLSGTPTDGDGLIIEITGTAARAITWGASFEASTVALPTTTVSTDKLTVGFIWNSATSKWRCIASV